MTIQFTKMHGLGNDFMVIDGITQSIHLTSQIIQHLADRHRGVGFDQCLLIEKSNSEQADFFYRIFNANGQEVGQCGNGARCVAKFILQKKLSDKTKLTLATKTTQMNVMIEPDDQVTVELEKPQFEPQNIPLDDVFAEAYSIYHIDKTYHFHALSVGNPHAVLAVSSVEAAEVSLIGQVISTHKLFPQGANVGFMQLINSHKIKLRVFERGCGETLACGSGAVAAAIIARKFYQADSTIEVELLGGNLIVHWPHESGPVWLTGPATFVYEGTLLE